MRPAALGVALAAALLAAPAAHASPHPAVVPFGFFGVDLDGPGLAGSTDTPAQFGRMAGVGVESVIAEVNWGFLQPTADQAPDYTRIDRVVLAAAARGISVIADVLYPPQWAAIDPGNTTRSPPDPAKYAGFLTALVARYGPGGTLWQDNPGVPEEPVRSWQICNEPNFWSVQPFADDYVEVLRRAHDALKAADPGSQVLLAGLTNRSWLDLARLYRAGAQDLYDVLSLHPFTARPRDVLRVVARNRAVMTQYGDDRKPIMITETTWPSSKGRLLTNANGLEVTRRGQAAKLRQLLPLLARRRHALGITAVYWSTWLQTDRGTDTFHYSGLNALHGTRVVPKPALAAYEQTVLPLEGCTAKGATARRCR